MTLRITSGKLKGLRLLSPTGASIRPMTDRVRKALFDILTAKGRGKGAFLDLYSGTGAVGLEAASRGAERVVFVDKGPEALRLIRENLKKTGVLAEIISHDLSRGLPKGLKGLFEIISITPPYGKGLAEKTLRDVAKAGLLAPGGVVVVEERQGCHPPQRIGPLVLKDKRRYGQSELWFYEEEK
ncbi:16S rRNA (guanine(966)-N(2))-methyltransferase RsmD [Thermosulfuriphilus sp.]